MIFPISDAWPHNRIFQFRKNAKLSLNDGHLQALFADSAALISRTGSYGKSGPLLRVEICADNSSKNNLILQQQNALIWFEVG